MDYLKTGDRAAAAGLAKDWANLADVPQAWSIKFALAACRRRSNVPEAIDILERAKTTSNAFLRIGVQSGGLVPDEERSRLARWKTMIWL